MGTGGSFPGVKRPRSEVDHSPPTTAEVKKIWIYTSIPHTPSWHSAYLTQGQLYLLHVTFTEDFRIGNFTCTTYTSYSHAIIQPVRRWASHV
jgi:hypothetical protein